MYHPTWHLQDVSDTSSQSSTVSTVSKASDQLVSALELRSSISWSACKTLTNVDRTEIRLTALLLDLQLHLDKLKYGGTTGLVSKRITELNGPMVSTLLNHAACKKLILYEEKNTFSALPISHGTFIVNLCMILLSCHHKLGIEKQFMHLY